MYEIIFSHRPLAGISVGARDLEEGGVAFAFALTNDGTSRNRIFHRDRHDSFCRRTARKIIQGRLESNNSQVHITTDLTARQFIAEYRKMFKPTVNEFDDVFVDVSHTDYGVETRFRKTAADIVDTLMSIAHMVQDSVPSKTC